MTADDKKWNRGWLHEAGKAIIASESYINLSWTSRYYCGVLTSARVKSDKQSDIAPIAKVSAGQSHAGRGAYEVFMKVVVIPGLRHSSNSTACMSPSCSQ